MLLHLLFTKSLKRDDILIVFMKNIRTYVPSINTQHVACSKAEIKVLCLKIKLLLHYTELLKCDNIAAIFL